MHKVDQQWWQGLQLFFQVFSKVNIQNSSFFDPCLTYNTTIFFIFFISFRDKVFLPRRSLIRKVTVNALG